MKKLLLQFLILFLFQANLQAQSYQWSKNYEPEAWPTNAEALDDGVVLAGQFKGSVTIGSYNFNFPFSFSNIYQGYVARYDATGNLVWAKRISSGNLTAIRAKTDFKKNIILTGTYQDSLVINNVQFFNATGTSGFFVLKLDPNGNILWALNSSTKPAFTHPYPTEVNTEVDALGNIYLNSVYRDALSFGSFSVQATTPSTQGIFLTKISADGNVKWLSNVNNNLPVFPAAESRVAVSNSGTAYVTIGNGDRNSTVSRLYKFKDNGLIEWNRPIPIGSDFDCKVPELGVDESGCVYLAGKVAEPITLGATTLLPGSSIPHDPKYFLAKITPAGKWVWANQINVVMQYVSFRVRINSKITNSIWLAPTIDGNITIAGTTHQSLGGGSTRMILMQADTTGTIFNSATLYGTYQGTDPENYPYSVSTDPFGNFYLLGMYASNINLGSTTLNAFPAVPNQHNTSHSFFLTKVLDNANHLSGRLYIDANANGIKDANEIPYPNAMVELGPGPLFVSADDSGRYTVPVNPGAYTLKVAQPANHYLPGPVTHAHQFNSNGQTAAGKDFGLVPVPNRDEVTVTVTNVNPARPGFTLRYRLTLQNNGTTTLSDTVTLYYDASRLTFLTSPVTPSLNQAGKIQWYYSNLAPTQKRNLDVHFTVGALTPLGTSLQAVADIKPYTDYVAWNNLDTLQHLVTGSFDPNDKQVNRTIVRPLEVAAGKYLDYLIRFQNTGTDTAFTVVVQDSISTRLLIPSMELLSASHPFTFKMLANSKAEWRFENILLPDSNRNEPGSHGFIRYRMLVKNTVPTGDSIKSRAAIYFDYNYPVYTNNALTRVEPIPVIDVAVMAITHPITGCQFSSQTNVNVALKNFGNGPITGIPLSYSINGVPMASEVFTGKIPAGGTANFTFATKANMVAAGSYQLAVQTSLAADTFGLNNTVQNTIHSAPLAPVITAVGPTNFCQGNSVRLTANVSTPVISYKWYVNGILISGASQANLVVKSGGVFHAVAYSAATCNSPFSAATTVTVQPTPTAPVITRTGSLLSANTGSGNQWYLNGTAIAGATGQTYPVTSNGTYSVKNSVNGCSSAASNTITITNTGLKEHADKATFKVYPNPASGTFTMAVPAANTSYTATLYNLAGQALKIVQIGGSEQEVLVQVPELAAGTYLLKLASEKEILVTRVILY